MITADDFERQYAERSGLTVKELRDFGRVIRPCGPKYKCDDPACEGWQSTSADSWEYDRRPSSRRGFAVPQPRVKTFPLHAPTVDYPVTVDEDQALHEILRETADRYEGTNWREFAKPI